MIDSSRPQQSDRLSYHLVAVIFAPLCGVLVQLPHWLLDRAFVNLDHNFHYGNAREFVASLWAGDPWPHWSFLAQHGLGEPGLLYYSPLYYMATGGAFALTGNVWAAMQAVEIVSAGVLGYFCWRLAACYAPPRAALVAVPLAVFAPMACLLHLSFNGYPWAVALAPLAMLAWASLRPSASERWLNPAAIVALALTIATHTVTGLMALIMLGAISLSALISQRLGALRGRRFWSPVVTVLGGLALSAAYLLPAFGSQDLIDAEVWRRSYTPFNAFAFPTITAAVFGLRWFVFQWPVAVVAVALAGLALWPLHRSAPDGSLARLSGPALCILGVTVFLSSELSYPLWLIDTPLRNIQFPHRLITLLVPLAAVLAVIVLARRIGPAPLRWLLGATACASLALGLLVVAKAAISDGEVIDVSERRFAPYGGLDEYRTAASMKLRAPRTRFDWSAECASRGVQCAPGRRAGRGMTWSVTATRATVLRLPIYCFPAWTVTVDGREMPVRCDSERALVSVPLEAGPARLDLQWRTRPIEAFGMAITALTAMLLAIATLVASRSRRRV